VAVALPRSTTRDKEVKNMDKDPEYQWKKPNPALKDLQMLAGEWEAKGDHPYLPDPVRGHASFGCLYERAFLVWRSDYEQPGPPSGLSLINRDETSGLNALLYYDQRSISWICQMSLEDKVWKFWRDAPGFRQPMTAWISADLNSIAFRGEICTDGVNWEQDLDLTFTRFSQPLDLDPGHFTR
jgi:hypothetical protein